jgi:hypothetical protein
MKKIVFSVCLLIGLAFNAVAHVGSPGVTFEGGAGPYKIIANINPPDVIPGTAAVTVYLEGAAKGTQVSAKPVYWSAGADGTPKADSAEPSATEPGRFDVKVWFMSTGTSSIEITINGPQGKGTVVVPVMAVSTAKRSMPAALGWGLFAMAAFLVILMITIISSSVSDSQLNPAEPLTKRLRRRRVTGAVSALMILGLILWGGYSWWNAAAASYSKYLYRPLQATTTLNAQNGLLKFIIDTAQLNELSRSRRGNVTRKMNYLVPDHGKLMHMFLVKADALDVFAHLHPRRADSVTFVTQMPDLPAGKYWIYADITRLSGFAETIIDTLDIPETIYRQASNPSGLSRMADKDDTYFISNAINSKNFTRPSVNAVMCGAPGVETKLQDGTSAVWVQKPGQELKAGELTELTFEMLDENRKPAKLEPYLGMMAHAVILKDDGSVYIHLHPSGSYSMGSQKALLDRMAFHQSLDKYLPAPTVFADSVNRMVASLDAMNEGDRNQLLMAGMKHAKASSNEHNAHQISFPYTFPQPGKYRIWVQTKRNGKILNSAFDADVK